MNKEQLESNAAGHTHSRWRVIACSLLLLLTACNKPADNAVTAYEWHQETAPASSIQIYENSPDEVSRRCPQSEHAGACADVGGNTCIIHFAKTWNEDWKLLEHELMHCAGWNHP